MIEGSDIEMVKAMLNTKTSTLINISEGFFM